MSCKRTADAIEGATSSAQLRAEGERRRRRRMEEAQKKLGMPSLSSPCAACKLLRRRCVEDCLFAPHFPADEPRKFANVHKVFGASNVGKLLQEIAVEHRSDTASSLVYEAEARISDPVYGCVGAISALQTQMQELQAQLAVAQAKLFHLRTGRAAYLARLGGVSARRTAATESRGSGSGGSPFVPSPERNRLAVVAVAKLLYGMDMVLQEETDSREPPISSC